MRVRIELDAGGADAQEREDAAAAVREELLQGDVDAVERPSETPPPGARAAEAAVAGTLLVTLAQPAAAMVAGTLQRWLSRGGDRRVRLEIGGDALEVDRASADDQRQLIAAFLARHAEE